MKNATVAQSVEQLIRNQQVAGSSPASSSKKIQSTFVGCIFLSSAGLDGVEGGSYFARAKYFALQTKTPFHSKAKAAIDNGRAGRAAKGASPASSSKKIQSTLVGCIFLFFIL